jgi:hypothetical protein
LYRGLLLLYVLDGFFKWTLKSFLFLLINQALILERLFILEYHIFEYLITGGYCQNHVDNNIVLFGCSRHYLSLEHGLNCILIRVVINFMCNGIADEMTINDGTKFLHFSTTSFVIGLNSYTSRLGWNSNHCYLLFVLKFFVWVVWIPMAMLLRMFPFIALTTNRIYLPSFVFLLLLGWLSQQLPIFISISHTFFTSDSKFFMLKKVYLFIPIIAIQKYGYRHVKKNCQKTQTIICMNVESNLLISIYIHSILPPFHLYLTLSFIMPCTLVCPFVLFGQVYKMQPLTLQINKRDGLS